MMTTPTDVILEIPCPVDVYRTLRAAGFDKDSLSREAREALAVRLYGEHRLSLGKAAEFSGLPIVRFMDLLRSLGMPVAEYGEEEWEQDLKTVAQLTHDDREQD